MASGTDQAVFNDCFLKIKELKQADVHSLNHLIDLLNSLNFSKLRIDNKVISFQRSNIVFPYLSSLKSAFYGIWGK